MNYRNDMTGQKFGRLTVLTFAGKNQNNKTMWECLCECGKYVIARADALKSGDKKSCGCLNNDRRSERCKARNTKHGMSHTRLYTVWCDMRRRCNKANDNEYRNYGARGIKVCDEWNSDFKAFYKWSMENGYDGNAKHGQCTIDRIDVNGNYSPDNCRFVDNAEQARNKRNNRRITHNGVTKTQAEWARHYGENPAFFCGPDELIERRMEGCDEYMRNGGVIPKFAHCAKRSAEYARRKM